MSEIKQQSLEAYLDDLASKQATPGGGSAAALMGAQGAALVSMVCNLTLGKPKYAAVESEIQALLLKSEQLRGRLLAMIKADVDVFNQLMACYGLPKTTDLEKAQRLEQIQQVLKQATQVPFDCALACAEVIDLARIAAEKGNLGVISDAGVAVMSAYAGFKSAALNVDINAAGLKDKDFAEAKLLKLQEIAAIADNAVQEIYQIVKDKLH